MLHDRGLPQACAGKLLARDWSPHFKVGTILKDLTYLQELAGEVGVAAAVEAGLEDVDFSGVFEVS